MTPPPCPTPPPLTHLQMLNNYLRLYVRSNFNVRSNYFFNESLANIVFTKC